MSRADLTTVQLEALDALVSEAVALGMATNEHKHREHSAGLQERIDAFLLTLGARGTSRTLAGALNASLDLHGG